VLGVLLVVVMGNAVPAQASTAPGVAESRYDESQVLNLINQQRAANHLYALRYNSELFTAALNHGRRMYQTNTLSHQLPGEPSLGARITAVGYAWRAIGENIGVVGDWSLSAIEALEKMMYNETAPNDPHRLILLSRTYRDVGLNIYMDSVHHKAWLTIDFALHA
jgi:uncharacterized protein YkwD